MAAKSTSEPPHWKKAISTAAEPDRVRHYLRRLAEGPADYTRAGAEQARVLAALFSGSRAMSDLLVADPQLGQLLRPEALDHPRQAQGLHREVKAWLEPALAAGDYSAAYRKLRQFKRIEMLRIAARDLARTGSTIDITRELSNLADVCLSAVLELCRVRLQERFGRPYHQNAGGHWQDTEFVVLGLGKLGGQELNYSSDVDVMFIYSEEGEVFHKPPGKRSKLGRGMSNHQFFKRLAENFVVEISRSTTEGMLFRIDLRLRPEGDAGPLVRSLASYENYYAQWGQTWERMMLIKARPVAGEAALGAEFLEMINPFRYPRSISERAVQEIAAIKARIETEVVKAGELDRNVKLGRGGIREIEFVVQTLQLLHGGRIPFLQGSQTLPVLQKLVQYQLLPERDAAGLAEAYCFLRDVEHRLQMEDNRQTHTIPSDASARRRLAALMGFKDEGGFETARRRHSRHVRSVYDRLLQADRPGPADRLPQEFQEAAAEWKRILAGHSFRDVDKAFRLVTQFASGPGYVHISSRTLELARHLISRLLALCPKAGERKVSQGRGEDIPPPLSQGSRRAAKGKSSARQRGTSGAESAQTRDGDQAQVLSDPDRVLTRLDSFVEKYGARATLFETWTSNPSLFDLLLLLFDRSEFLAETAIRTPDLVDELVLSGQLRRRKSADETLRDLRHGRADKDQRLWLRRYHQTELMRIGLRDILGLADFEQNLLELSALADACLQYALEAVLRKHQLKKSPLVIVGLGKLGGQEINYGSDLDIIFIANNTANLPRLQQMALEIMDMLSSQTELGVAFETDARLRPDGEKGLLVNTLDAYEDYYRQRAQLWEIQAISRARPIAGDMALGGQFQKLVAVLTDFRPENVEREFASAERSVAKSKGRTRKKGTSEIKVKRGLAAYSPDWKAKTAHMRQRIEKERTPAGQDALAIKTGSGGLMDAEFIAQTLCLANGWREASTLRALERAGSERILARTDADKLIKNYRQLRRVEGILRRWSYEGETVLPADAAPLYRVAVRCGWPGSDEFLSAVAQYRKTIREVYLKVLP